MQASSRPVISNQQGLHPRLAQTVRRHLERPSQSPLAPHNKAAWDALATRPRVLGVVAGVNAAVVGLLAAAWVNPIASSAFHGWLDVLLVLLGWALLARWRPPILLLVAGFAGAGLALGGT